MTTVVKILIRGVRAFMGLTKPSERGEESYQLILQSRNFCRQNLKKIFLKAKLLNFYLLGKRLLVRMFKDWDLRILRWPQLVNGNMASAC